MKYFLLIIAGFFLTGCQTVKTNNADGSVTTTVSLDAKAISDAKTVISITSEYVKTIKNLNKKNDTKSSKPKPAAKPAVADKKATAINQGPEI